MHSHKGLAQKWGGREVQEKTYAHLENNGGMSSIPYVQGERSQKGLRFSHLFLFVRIWARRKLRKPIQYCWTGSDFMMTCPERTQAFLLECSSKAQDDKDLENKSGAMLLLLLLLLLPPPLATKRLPQIPAK